jgi:gamma-glutamylcyclotransferase (GGCT)/AIG2-like uncharacterized protein YtfP
LSELIALYGTLMSGLAPRPAAPDLTGHIRLIGACQLSGLLYDGGPYPCLVAGGGRVHGELWRILTDDALQILDRWEDYDPQSPADSEYVRRRVRLAQPLLHAWVYHYNGATEGLQPITDGDWRAHIQSRTGGARRPGG